MSSVEDRIDDRMLQCIPGRGRLFLQRQAQAIQSVRQGWQCWMRYQAVMRNAQRRGRPGDVHDIQRGKRATEEVGQVLNQKRYPFYIVPNCQAIVVGSCGKLVGSLWRDHVGGERGELNGLTRETQEAYVVRSGGSYGQLASSRGKLRREAHRRLM